MAAASVSSALLCWSSSVGATAGPVAQPDILLIMPDQMRGDCLSAAGHPVVRTPNLDRLAAEGALFRRAYTPVSSCVPARYALLTGLHPQTSGVVGYRAKPLATPSMPAELARAGYATVLVGRNMHQPAASASCGYGRRILGSTYVDDDDYDRFLKKAAPATGGIRSVVKQLGLSFNFWQAAAWNLQEDLHPTTWIVQQSRDVIAESDPGKPLFLTASFYAPHPPLFPPKRLFDRCLAADLPSPAKGDWVAWDELSPKGDKQGHRIRLEGKILRAAQAGYFALVEHIDEQIALLSRDFRARSERSGRPWVIVVTSDHGEMLGDHGYFRKCEPYEGSANVPFVIAGSPELDFRPGLRINQPVCLEDIMPTLLSLAGTEIPPVVDGVNLVPVLQGTAATIRDWYHFEHAPCYSQAQAYHALTDGRYKYIWRPLDGTEQLFDLDTDPAEEHDLTSDPAAQQLVANWRKRLVERLFSRPEGFVQNGRLVPGREYLPLNPGTLG